MGLREGIELKSTTLEDVIVKPGSKLSLASLDKYRNYIEWKNRKEDQRKLKEEIGYPPYELLHIYSHPPLNVITFDIQGKKGIKEKISKFSLIPYKDST